jgi:hypothetical protein
MLSCRAAKFIYGLAPVGPWRAFLIRVHFERCPRCSSELAGAAEARALFVREAEFRPAPEVRESIVRLSTAGGDAPAKTSVPLAGRRLWRWAAAAAGIVMVLLVGDWVRRGFRPAGGPPLSVAAARFELDYIRVDGQPADAYIYQPQGSDMIIVWAGKTP